MRHWKNLRALGAVAVMAGAIAGLTDCTAANNALAGCDGVDARQRASILAFNDAAAALDAQAQATAALWLSTCNAINGELGLDTSQTSADKACQITANRIKAATAKGVTVTLDVAYACSVDASVEAKCDANCYAAVNCDVAAKCEPGKLVVDCEGSCDAECTFTKPEVTCQGSCEGECSVDVSAACSGSCQGSCDAQWTGSCDAGCTASFSGSCGGNCNGTCDGAATTGSAEGNCAGKCVGTCSARASGSCMAQCTSNFQGSCTGTCKGSCAVKNNSSCTGHCSGSCTAKGGAECHGGCHGHCTGTAQPPRCEGHLDCNVDANCTASCQSKAEVSASCGGHANWVVTGDAALYNSLLKHADDIGKAINQSVALAGDAVNTVVAFGKSLDASAAAAVCAAGGIKASAEASVNVSVSVQASASISGSATAS